jgi:hemerythrin superfamily protein
MERTMTTDDTTTGTPRDAIDILTRDHGTVNELFKKFAALAGSATTTASLALVHEICTELTIHAAIEEEIFYPAVRKTINDDDLMNEAEIEHATAKFLIKQLLPLESDDEYFHAKVTVLREYTRHHINEEESEMFPKIRKSQLDLTMLGQQIMERKTALKSQLTAPEQLIAFTAS